MCILVDFKSHSDFKAFENLDDDVRQEKCQLPLDLLRFIVQSGFDVLRYVWAGKEWRVQYTCVAAWAGALSFLLIPASPPGTDLRLGPKVTWFHLREVLGLLLRSSPKCCPSWPHRQMVRHPFTPHLSLNSIPVSFQPSPSSITFNLSLFTL